MPNYTAGGANVDPGEDASVLDVRTLISIVRINLLLFVSVFLAIFVLIIGITMTMPPKYTSSSSVMIGGSKVKVTPTAQDVAADLPADSTQIDTEVEVLKSVGLAEAVMERQHLDKDPEFNPTLASKGGIVSSLKGLLGRKSVPTDPESVHQAILTNLLKVIAVKRQGLTRVITVSVQTGSPIKSAQIADAWMQAYMTRQVATKNAALSDANSELKSRLEELRSQASEADAAVERYKIANGLTGAGDTSLPEQQLTFLHQQAAAADASVAESQARLSSAQQQLSGKNSATNDALTSDTIRDLRAHSADVSARLAQLKSRYGPMHPEVLKATNEQQAIDAQIKAESQRILSNLQTEANVDRQKQYSLHAAIGASRATLNNNLSANVKLRDLQLSADAAHTVYETYLGRYKDMTTQEGLDTANARVISQAKVPTTKSSPKMALALLLALGAGVAGGGVVVGVKYSMRRGITSGTEVSNQLGVAYLGGIADLNSTVKVRVGKNVRLWDYLAANPLSVFAEQYKILLSAIKFSTVNENKRVIAFTSAIPGEGKTTTSMCMAKTIQMQGQSVVVVDCDLRRRSVTSQLDGTFDKGLIEVLEGSSRLDEVLHDGGNGVIYVPVSNKALPSETLFGTQVMHNFLETLKQRFDVVILDTAPVLPIVDTRILAHQADVVIVLAKWDDTPLGATRTALDILQSEGLRNIAGVALTLVDIKKQAMSSGIGSEYYYNSYKSYYVQ